MNEGGCYWRSSLYESDVPEAKCDIFNFDGITYVKLMLTAHYH